MLTLPAVELARGVAVGPLAFVGWDLCGLGLARPGPRVKVNTPLLTYLNSMLTVRVPRLGRSGAQLFFGFIARELLGRCSSCCLDVLPVSVFKILEIKSIALRPPVSIKTEPDLVLESYFVTEDLVFLSVLNQWHASEYIQSRGYVGSFCVRSGLIFFVRKPV